MKYLGVIRADPNDYLKRYGPWALTPSDQLPDYVKNIPTPPGIRLAADEAANPRRPPELYGDVHALRLVDLDKVGLGEYRGYSNNSSHRVTFSDESFSGSGSGSGMNQTYSHYSSGHEGTSATTKTPSPVANNLSDLIEKAFFSISKDLNCRISIYDSERLFNLLNRQMGRHVSESSFMDFFNLLHTHWDGNVDLSEFKRAFVATI